MSSHREILDYLYGLRRLGIRPGLSRIRRLLDSLENPQERYASIHVAGTNGKGSCAAMTASMLGEAGLRTGLYTSPHLSRFNERIRVGGRLITDTEVVATARELMRASPKGRGEPTFFEFTTAMAFVHFAARGVDVAVVETGMGGRLDATNVLAPAVSVITNIGNDHAEHLGPGLAAIAGEKAGIIKPGVPVVTGALAGRAARVVEKAARSSGSPLYRLGRDFHLENVRSTSRGCSFDYCGIYRSITGLRTGLRGLHQAENAAAACAAAELATRVLGTGAAPVRAVRRGLARAAWPGRLEVVGRRPLVVLDAAHNAQAAEALCAAIKGFGYERLVLVAGIMEEKDADGILRRLAPLAHAVILAAPRTVRAARPEGLARIAARYNEDVATAPGVARGVRLAMDAARTLDAVCVTGSIYTVGEARAYLKRVRAVRRHKGMRRPGL